METLVQRAFVVNAPRSVAWDHLSRVEAWPSWARHIRRVRLDPPGRLTSRSRGRFLLRGGIRSTFTMTQFDPPTSWTWVGPFLWWTIRYDHRFEPLDERHTRLVWTVAANGRPWLVGRVFAAAYGRNLDRAIPNLQRELDAAGHAGNRHDHPGGA
jgi:Polyketide cyclase / dehydrase and lipid transport